jgi:hypothetical protein
MAKIVIYAVNSGSDFDYRIDALFSTKENAKRYMATCRSSAACSNKNFNDLEEYVLDAALKEKNYIQYFAALMLDDGSLIARETGSREYFGVPMSSTEIAESVACYDHRAVVRTESHKSAKHALKLAAEARQVWLRNKKP